jgi:hypothetical protein
MLKLNRTVIKVVGRTRCHCFWEKKDREKHDALAAWEMVCKQKDKGGLGGINLEIQNDALLMKHLFKFFSHHETPWVNMVWQAYYQNPVPQATSPVGSFLWQEDLLALTFPWIYSFAIDTSRALCYSDL